MPSRPSKLRAGAVGNTDIADGSVTGAKIADSSITAADIKDGEVVEGNGRMLSVARRRCPTARARRRS